MEIWKSPLIQRKKIEWDLEEIHTFWGKEDSNSLWWSDLGSGWLKGVLSYQMCSDLTGTMWKHWGRCRINLKQVPTSNNPRTIHSSSGESQKKPLLLIPSLIQYSRIPFTLSKRWWAKAELAPKPIATWVIGTEVAKSLFGIYDSCLFGGLWRHWALLPLCGIFQVSRRWRSAFVWPSGRIRASNREFEMHYIWLVIMPNHIRDCLAAPRAWVCELASDTGAT